jgi:glycine/D-amino acid oxidase-like deaminating enzyme
VTASAAAGVVIIGGGIAGGLLALALRDQGQPVTLIDAPGPPGVDTATAISYGALPGWPLAPTPLARLAAGASRQWRRLQKRHGELGWRPARLRVSSGLARAISLRLPLPFAQVNAAALTARLPRVLEAAGVKLAPFRLMDLGPCSTGGWQLQLADRSRLVASCVVLAAGAGCRQLWPSLPQRLRCSWAAVLELPAFPAGLGPPAAWLPQAFTRVDLERRAEALPQPQWVVDAGLAPWGEGALLGQHTLIKPALEAGLAPAALEVERQLRQALGAGPAWSLDLAPLPARLRQAAVAFCTDGHPLVGPVPAAPGLWLFSGFSAGFSQVPVLAPLLAQQLVAAQGGTDPADQTERRLRQLGVWPEGTPGTDRTT